MVKFYPDEIRRIEDVELILLGIQPSELERMSPQQRYDVLELHAKKQEIQAERMRPRRKR